MTVSALKTKPGKTRLPGAAGGGQGGACECTASESESVGGCDGGGGEQRSTRSELPCACRSRDFYHTCYCLSGLSIAQHFGSGAMLHDVVLGVPENALVRQGEGAQRACSTGSPACTPSLLRSLLSPPSANETSQTPCSAHHNPCNVFCPLPSEPPACVRAACSMPHPAQEPPGPEALLSLGRESKWTVRSPQVTGPVQTVLTGSQQEKRRWPVHSWQSG